MTSQAKPLGVVKILAIVMSGVAIFLLLSGGCVVIFIQLFTAHPAYQAAMKIIKENSDVIEALGEPIETALLPLGEIEAKDGGGRAELRISISGPRGKASAKMRAVRSEGEWRLIELMVRLEDGRILNLLEQDNQP
jgi:hypothetical protein